MASCAFFLLSACVLLLAQGHRVALCAGQELPQNGEFPVEPAAGSVSDHRGAESTGPTLPGRHLAALLRAVKGALPVKGAVHPQDAAALLKAAARWKKDIKNGSAVDSRKLLSTWNVRRPCSQWFGVTCDSKTRRVTAIRLTSLGGQTPFFKLSGPFPPELGSLPELRSLILARNAMGDVEDPFPKTWSRLRKLLLLDLSGNRGPRGGVVSPLPQVICDLTSLTYLNYGDRVFEGLPKQFTRLSRLVRLDLSKREGSLGQSDLPLREEDLRLIGSLTRLRFLSLSDTYLDLSSLNRLSRLRNLQQLDISGIPSLGSFPPFVKGLPHLVDLRLGTIISGDNFGSGLLVPAWIGSLRGLTNLDLSGNSILSLPKLGGLSRLARLSLRGNKLGGKVPQEFVNSRSLVHLDLSYNKFNLGGITFGPQASSRLRSLDLSGNSESRTVLKSLSRLTRLESLSVRGNQLAGAIPQFLWTRPTLTRLDLSKNNLTGFGFSSQLKKPGQQLRRLDLSRNKFQGPIPAGWSALRSLATLSLSYNKLTGGIPAWLGRLKGLAALDLSSNQLTGKIPAQVGQLKALGTLNLTRNRLTGVIPPGLGSLRGLVTLGLASNQLTGSIPGGLGAMSTLVTLSLSSNQLTGPIPARLGTQKALATVDLGVNKLTGSAPGSLFQAGRELRIADNQLAGALPERATKLIMRRLIAAFNQLFFPGSVDVSGNYLTGLCYSELMSRFLSCPLDLETCTAIGREALKGLNVNCFVCSSSNSSLMDDPRQRSKAQCSSFCAASEPKGPCNGHGFCSLKGPKKTPTCTCSKGFVAPGSNPGSCVRKTK